MQQQELNIIPASNLKERIEGICSTVDKILKPEGFSNFHYNTIAEALSTDHSKLSVETGNCISAGVSAAQEKNNMQAFILAAGMGKRLGEFTEDKTKCMVPLLGKTLIERNLNVLIQFPLNRIILVGGYKGREVEDFIGSAYHAFRICRPCRVISPSWEPI